MNKMLIKRGILYVFFLWTSLALPQGAIIKQYFARYDDLSGPIVKSIAADRNNVMWFATNTWGNISSYIFERVSSFDGINWKQYRIDSLFTSKPNINSIMVDKQNIKWICTQDGIVRYDGVSFVRLSQSNSSLPDGNYYCAASDNHDNIYFSLPNRIIKYSNNAINIFNIADLNARDIITDSKGVLWIAGGKLGLIRYDENTLKTIPCILPTGETMPVKSLTVDNFDNVWIVGNQAVGKHSLAGWEFYYNDSPYTYLPPIKCDKNNLLYVNTSRGPSRLNGTQFELLIKDNEKNLSPFLAFAFDKHNNIWMGTEEGAVRIKDETWSHFYASYGLPSDGIFDVIIDKNNVKWLATIDGLVRFDGLEWKSYNVYNSPLRSKYINQLLIKDDALWIGEKGIIKYDGTNWTRITTDSTGPYNQLIRSMGFEYDTLWVATVEGLYKYYDKSWTKFTTSNASMITNSLRQVSVDKYGNKWIIPYGNLPVMRYNHPRWEWFYRDENGWPHERSYFVYSDSSGDKWFTYQGGIIRYNNGIKQIIRNSDIPGNAGPIGALGRDKSGKLVFIFDNGKKFALFDDFNWKYISILSQGNSVLGTTGLAFDKNNNWWIGQHGLHVYNESGVLSNSAENLAPKTFQLHQNHPNPFNPSTIINYTIQKSGPVHLTVFDPLGRKISTIVDGYREAGLYSETFNGSNLPSGIYFYTLSAGGFSITKKMMLLK